MGDVLGELFGSYVESGRKLEFSTIRDVISENLNAPVATNSEGGTVTATTFPKLIHIPVNEEVPGRIGPQIVQLSRNINLGPLKLTDSDTEVEAQCHLGSILATVCVYEGKWQYEATIGTAGIQQIGWAPHSCPFTNEEGVGDSTDSYAFDGNRTAKWHNGFRIEYGQAWVPGDVIGSCIDLEKGTITFYRNGKSMGEAFNKVRKGVGYFPAISLSYGETCFFNFGRRPFEYPAEGFSPIQSPPFPLLPLEIPKLKDINTTSRPKTTISLLSVFHKLLHMEQDRLQGNVAWVKDDILVTASILFEYVAPLLQQEYHVANVWYPFLVATLTEGQLLLQTLMDWMLLFLEPFEWGACLNSLFMYISYKCRTVGIIYSTQHSQPSILSESPPPPSPSNFPALSLALQLLSIPNVFHFAVSQNGFPQQLEHLITFKQPSKADLAVVIPFVWWQGGEGETACSEASFLRDMGLLNATVRVHEDLVRDLFHLLFRAYILDVSYLVEVVLIRIYQNLALLVPV